MMWFLYNILFFVVFLLLTPHFLWRMRRRGGYWPDFAQRFACYSEAFRAQAGARSRSWIHAVSVGEVLVALAFMKEVRRKHPDAAFVLSVTTSTGHRIAREKLLEQDQLMYFPVDAPFIMKKVLGLLKPERIILVEGEIWPNLTRLAAARGVPISLINGRLSDSSFSGYRKLSFLTRRILPMIQPICMQGERDRKRMLSLGATADSTLALGSAKFDVAPCQGVEDGVAQALLKQAGLAGGRAILLGGSTWPGEEALLVDLYRTLRERLPDLALVLVPRHAERAPEILSMLQAKGQGVIQRSVMKLDAEASPSGGDEVLLVDSTGELMSFYQAADVIFVGKSLCGTGGQNPLESAALGKATVVGPHMENFPSVMELLMKDEALIQVADVEELTSVCAQLLSEPVEREALGQRAARSVACHRGVLERTVALVFGAEAER